MDDKEIPATEPIQTPQQAGDAPPTTDAANTEPENQEAAPAPSAAPEGAGSDTAVEPRQQTPPSSLDTGDTVNGLTQDAETAAALAPNPSASDDLDARDEAEDKSLGLSRSQEEAETGKVDNWWYNHQQEAEEKSDRLTSIDPIVYFRDPEFPNEVKLRTALVTQVNEDGSVSLNVFYRNHQNTVHDVAEGDDLGQFRTV